MEVGARASPAGGRHSRPKAGTEMLPQSLSHFLSCVKTLGLGSQVRAPQMTPLLLVAKYLVCYLILVLRC